MCTALEAGDEDSVGSYWLRQEPTVWHLVPFHSSLSLLPSSTKGEGSLLHGDARHVLLSARFSCSLGALFVDASVHRPPPFFVEFDWLGLACISLPVFLTVALHPGLRECARSILSSAFATLFLGSFHRLDNLNALNCIPQLHPSAASLSCIPQLHPSTVPS